MFKNNKANPTNLSSASISIAAAIAFWFLRMPIKQNPNLLWAARQYHAVPQKRYRVNRWEERVLENSSYIFNHLKKSVGPAQNIAILNTPEATPVGVTDSRKRGVRPTLFKNIATP
jgi:hypothetical protein